MNCIKNAGFVYFCAGSGEGCQWQALPSPVQCEETATQTRDLPVTGGKTLMLAPGPPFNFPKKVQMKKNICYTPYLCTRKLNELLLPVIELTKKHLIEID